MNKYSTKIRENNVKPKAAHMMVGFFVIFTFLTFFMFTAGASMAQENKKNGQKQVKEKEKELRVIIINAKKFIAGKEWAKALESFQRVTEHYSGSKWEAQALYWAAYSLNKLNGPGGETQERKEEALYRLAELMERYPASQWVDDAKRLSLEIAEGLANKGYKKYKIYLEKAAEKAEADDLKISAVDALMHMDKEKALPVLEKLMRTNKNPEIRKKALFSLGQHRDPRVVKLLSEVAVKDPSQAVREQAIFWLGQYRDPESFKQLVKIYESTPASNRKMKKRLLFSISQADPGKGVDLLIKIYNKEKDIKIKKSILFYLGQSKSEKAQDFILKILE